MNDLISIIVPVYKVEQYLDQCIQSIVDQTYKNIEIILVDDGSPDECPKICDLWAKKDNRIKVIHQENMGISEVRNIGVKNAKGKYIYWVDGDDYIEPYLCEKALYYLNQDKSDIVVFAFQWFWEDGKSVIESPTDKDHICISREQGLAAIMGIMHNAVWNKFMRREIYNDIKFPKGRTWEDLAVMYKLFMRSDKITYISDCMYFYRQRENSIVSSIGLNALCDIFYVRKNRYEDVKKIYPDIADIGFENLVLSALALYDRTLWEPTDREEVVQAVKFLEENRGKIFELNYKFRLILYYKYRSIYNLYKIYKHNMGSIIKRIKILYDI